MKSYYCKKCGAVVVGKYCSCCGTRVTTDIKEFVNMERRMARDFSNEKYKNSPIGESLVNARIAGFAWGEAENKLDLHHRASTDARFSDKQEQYYDELQQCAKLAETLYFEIRCLLSKY